MVKIIASEMVVVTLRRADNRTKKCKRVSNVFASREERNKGGKTRNVKPIRLCMRPVPDGREAKWYRVSDTEKARQARR